MSALPPGFKLRDATEEDTKQIAEILAHYTKNTLVTWSDGEGEVPTAESMLAKYRDFRRPASSSHHAPYPWLVVEEEEGAAAAEEGAETGQRSNTIVKIVGFAYAGPFRARTGWRFTCEDSIYLRPGYERKGLGRALLVELLSKCRLLGYRKMVAAISVDGSGNNARNDGLGLASVNLHKSCGFVDAGVFTRAGEKFGRIMDAVFLSVDI
jgi:phosphinothricin acetyltransferase